MDYGFSKETKKTYLHAIKTKDSRFDGMFFFGVKTTGIYCRPICPAKPNTENIVFFSSINCAEKEGYRPCLRCRPNTIPGSPAWKGSASLVTRVISRMTDGELIKKPTDEFLATFGISARHFRRLFIQEIGKTPQQFYQEQRLGVALRLLEKTSQSVTSIAFDAGYTSLRRFQDAFKLRFKKSPTEFRSNRNRDINEENFSFSLRYQQPFAWKSMLSYLKRHELSGVEEISNSSYTRHIKTPKGAIKIIVVDNEKKSCLDVMMNKFDVSILGLLLQKIRCLFDLDVDSLSVERSLLKVPSLKPLVALNRGIRVPLCWDPFETAIAIILGQQVSTQRAKSLLGKLIQTYGEQIKSENKNIYLFPEAKTLAVADLSFLGIPAKRAQCIKHISRLVTTGELCLSPQQEFNSVYEKLDTIPGVGPWTKSYIAMRCLGHPDAFPESDLILRKWSSEGLLAKASPFRAYAAQLIWDYSSKTKEQ